MTAFTPSLRLPITPQGLCWEWGVGSAEDHKKQIQKKSKLAYKIAMNMEKH